jgi:hypothetical protein
MVGIEVISNTNGVKFILNDYASILGFLEFFRTKSSIQIVVLMNNWVEYTTIDGKTFLLGTQFDLNQPNVLQVDKIDGVDVIDLKDLFDKIYNILAT